MEGNGYFFLNLDRSHSSPVDGFWNVRFHVSAIWKIHIFRAGPPNKAQQAFYVGLDQAYRAQVKWVCNILTQWLSNKSVATATG